VILPTNLFPSNVSIITPTAARFDANIRSGSSAASLIVEYGLDTTYGYQSAASIPVPISTTGVASTSITGLTPNTTYHYRYKATNHEGTTIGADATFTTCALPELTISPASYLGAAWARMNGIYNARGANYVVTFEYGTSTAYGYSAANSELSFLWG